MTVADLIRTLEKIEDKDQQVQIGLHQYNKIGVVAKMPLQRSIWNEGDVNLGQTAYSGVVIDVMLPYDAESFMYTGVKKLK